MEFDGNPKYDDFRNKVIPHLQNSGHFPKSLAHHEIEEFHKTIYEFVANNPDINTVSAQLFDLYAIENLDFHKLAIMSSSGLYSLQEVLRGKARGSKTVTCHSSHNACSVCGEAVNGKKHVIDELLLEYANASPSTRLLPHIDCEYLNSDGGGWCRCSWSSDMPPPSKDVDPEFEQWLQEQLKCI